MNHDPQPILKLLKQRPTHAQIDTVLTKANGLNRLSMADVATLLSIEESEHLLQLFAKAKQIKEMIYGKRLVIFAPLYLSNLCKNDCSYCGFRVSNQSLKRHALKEDELILETRALLKSGQKRILLVAGESYPDKQGLDYVLDAIKTIYAVKEGDHQIRRINVNIAPLTHEEFVRLKDSQIGTYQLFQETYHPDTYRKHHTKGPKSDYNFRLEAMDRAIAAGIDDIGLGVLFGLYDYKYEVLAMMQHIEHLEAKFGLGPHTLSVPRMEPADNSETSINPPFPVDDISFKKIIAVLRLAVPYTGIILSTRESVEMRQATFDLGVSQISAGSRTSPGGYTEASTGEHPSSEHPAGEQFSLGDHRPLETVIADICRKGFMPSFCTSCYRLGRTGLDFMEYAKPGDIKKKCEPNALSSFEEYLLDFASEPTKETGKILIRESLRAMPEKEQKQTSVMLGKVRKGKRDQYV